MSAAQGAWQVYKLADHLGCSNMLEQGRAYIDSSCCSRAALLSTASAVVLEWIAADHELGWEEWVIDMQ